MALEINHPLNLSHCQTKTLIINRLYTFVHSIALTLIISYRISTIFTIFHSPKNQPFIPHILIFISELTLSFIWLLSQSYLWRPITRTVFLDRLPEDDQLPPIDVFICTADPQKEPPLGVMNTVMSAMALNYPTGKLSIYLSDDGGCPVTLQAFREAWKFGKIWVPFCKKYGVKTICPEAYFAGRVVDDNRVDHVVESDEFREDEVKVKEEYKTLTQKVNKISESEGCIPNKDHSAVVEMMVDEHTDDRRQMPLLVYVSREKRPSQPHHFKAGALNTLLRVSSLISNSPYILGLDCDMYCNDENSARQAMCFHLDPKLSSSLAFVQFPQKFHNISKHDIYESELRYTFKTMWEGMDGIKGPCLSGTCYYLKREALYGKPSRLEVEDINLKEFKQSFGSSNELIRVLTKKCNTNLKLGKHQKNFTEELLRETKLLASCGYENDTKWGKEIGFRYFSVVEDFFTSFHMHCNQWISILYMPQRPSFLGAGTTSLNDVMVQGTRWTTGLIKVCVSRFSPLLYGPARMPILQSFCYAWLSLFPLACLPLWIFATIPQLSLLNGITIYPEIKNHFSLVFLYVFLLSNLQHMRNIHSTGASFQTWKHEQRVWMMKGITSHLYGTIHAIMEKIGAKEADFLPTNKVNDADQVKLYQMGIYNFQTPSLFIVPLCSLVTLNLLAFVVGMVKITVQRVFIDDISIQTFLSFYITLMGYPILEGMLLRKDKARIAPGVSFYSIIFSVIILSFGSLLVMY